MIDRSWICSQFGAREKYAIPRALHRQNLLNRMYTDMWVKPNSIISLFNNRAQGRFHPALADAQIKSFTGSVLVNRVRAKFLKGHIEEDHFYDKIVSDCILKQTIEGGIFFGYSYSSLLSMTAAKQRGFKTILGQINPGPLEAEIVIEECKKYENGKYPPHVPSKQYWEAWHQEVEAADKVIANSVWSRDLLVKAGVSERKLVIIPLAYEGEKKNYVRSFKKSFERARPLQLLYLGGIGIRKGFHILIEAMKQLKDEPVHLQVVGELKGPQELLQNLPANVSLHGSVPSHAVGEFYKKADVFMFPTLSDGFGLTQVEALSYGLPVIASTFCAQVIKHGVNGKILEGVSSSSIANSILELINSPSLIEYYSSNAQLGDVYSLSELATNLTALT